MSAIEAGAASVPITPPAGLAMAGFAARTQPATGAHDPLTVRALVVGDTAILVADVIGLDEETSARIRARAALPGEAIVVAALHTHGGPAVNRRGLGGPLDPTYLARLEDACVEALEKAAAARRPARLGFGMGADPGVARNRRREGGPTDPSLPLLRIRGADGGWIAVLAAYACHPVVLGPDNRQWTADYPGVVRARLEAAHPGAVALFLTGCCGDANIGHSAHASFSIAPSPERTFAAAERIGERIAAAALAAPEQSRSGPVRMVSGTVPLDLARLPGEDPPRHAAAWRAEIATADAGRAALLRAWIHWAEAIAPRPLEPWPARVSVLDWAGVRLIALPGEIFAETAHAIRARLEDPSAIVFAYADGCPGYIPPASEYPFGGYEVAEAHRYCGMPAAFATGSAERLADLAVTLCARLAGAAPN